MNSFVSEAESFFEYTQNLRRDFHRFPELGFQESRTSGIVASELAKFGVEVSTGIGGTGVVGLIQGKGPGSVVLVRFDMDALPIIEESDVEYASKNPGVMHACGHDGHVAIGLTVARLLCSHRDEFSGTVKLVFQPAEEGLGGAQRMIAERVLESPRPDISLALHLWNERPVGWIGVTTGPTMAAAEIFKITIIGKGGHGAVPNLAVDPILASANVITSLQSIVARNVSPLQTAVISVCSVHGGEAFNVIPPVVEMQGTIRTFEPTVRMAVLERFNRIIDGIASSFGCQAVIDVQSITPAVINDQQIAERVQKIAASILPNAEISREFRTMGSEDMAFMMEEIPGCYFFVGSSNAERGLNSPHHHPRFDIDENALPIGVALMAGVVIDKLKL
jgi:amidohydrolase